MFLFVFPGIVANLLVTLWFLRLYYLCFFSNSEIALFVLRCHFGSFCDRDYALLSLPYRFAIAIVRGCPVFWSFFESVGEKLSSLELYFSFVATAESSFLISYRSEINDTAKVVLSTILLFGSGAICLHVHSAPMGFVLWFFSRRRFECLKWLCFQDIKKAIRRGS